MDVKQLIEFVNSRIQPHFVVKEAADRVAEKVGRQICRMNHGPRPEDAGDCELCLAESVLES